VRSICFDTLRASNLGKANRANKIKMPIAA
jgi:hypothetical protein